MLPVLEQLARNFSVLLAAAFSSHRRDHNQVSAQLRRQEAASTEVVEAGARGPRCRAHRPLLNAQGNDWVLRRLLIWIKCIFKTKNNLGKKTIKPWLLLEPLFVASGKSSGSHWFLSFSAGFIGPFSVHSWCEARWEGALCLRYHQYQENLTVPCRFFLHLKETVQPKFTPFQLTTDWADLLVLTISPSKMFQVWLNCPFNARMHLMGAWLVVFFRHPGWVQGEHLHQQLRLHPGDHHGDVHTL